MQFSLIPFYSGAIQKQAAAEIVKCNNFTARFGLMLTTAQADSLTQTRFIALKENGRIEFGGGVIEKLIYAFCDSPYISQRDYAQTLTDLTEIFYYYKNETLDLISDDELISFMKSAFDGNCRGSLELLSGRELYELARDVRFGRSAERGTDSDEEEDDAE